jgi:phosphate transport system substrate-binding protein
VRTYATLALAIALSTTGFAQALKADPKLAPYQKAAGINGNLNSIGSDTLNNLMAFWVESFNQQYPNVKIQVEGKGSATAPPALIEGTAQLGPMSREMKGEEIDKFEKKYGYKPTKVAVAIDCLAVYVNKNNPVKELSMEDLDGIFSSTRKWGGKDLTIWGQAGLKGEWASKPFSIYGRNSASGTYGYFKEHALNKGDFRNTVKEQPGSSAVVQGVTNDRFGIGYSGIGYITSGVRAVPLSMKGRYNDQAFAPSYENALNGKYPMARFLYVYVNKHPKKGLDPLTKEFMKFVLSKEGQEIVIKDGYYPLTSSTGSVNCNSELARLN